MGIAVFLFLVIVLWKVPGFLVGDLDLTDKDLGKIKQIELEDNARRTLTQIVGGILALMAFYIAWRRVEVANETQITDRFTKAIEQLGNENLSIRLGGIYALARISRDSKKDHRQIMEVLTAFVREECPLNPDENENENESDDNADEEIQELPTDIQAILTIIVEKVWTEDEPQMLNLSKTSLIKANLKNGYLPFANFWGADLRGADLRGANLWRANLSEADLCKADLCKADLRWTDLRQAREVTCNQIRSANINEKTKMPDYLEITWISDIDYEIKEIYGY